MPTSLVAYEQPISRVFSNDYVFRIPSYQRPYAWGTDQARDFFEDLSALCGLTLAPAAAASLRPTLPLD
jgi:hypothetical protein